MDIPRLTAGVDQVMHRHAEEIVSALEGVSDAIGQQNRILQEHTALLERIADSLAAPEEKRGPDE